jgi:hypothetical protein
MDPDGRQDGGAFLSIAKTLAQFAGAVNFAIRCAEI